MNTGAQLSYSTPFGHRTSTSEVGTSLPGKRYHHKDTARSSPLPSALRVHRERGLSRGPDAQGREGPVVREERGAGVRQDPVLLPAQLATPRRGRRSRAAAIDHAASSRSTRSSTATRRSPTIRTRPAGRIPVSDWLKLMGKTRHLLAPANADILAGDPGRDRPPLGAAQGHARASAAVGHATWHESSRLEASATRSPSFRLDAPLIARRRNRDSSSCCACETGERIPITIADYDREAGTLTIVVQEVGAPPAGVRARGGRRDSRRCRVRSGGTSRSRRGPRVRRRRRLRLGRALA